MAVAPSSMDDPRFFLREPWIGWVFMRSAYVEHSVFGHRYTQEISHTPF